MVQPNLTQPGPGVLAPADPPDPQNYHSHKAASLEDTSGAALATYKPYIGT